MIQGFTKLRKARKNISWARGIELESKQNLTIDIPFPFLEILEKLDARKDLHNHEMSENNC